MKRNKSKVSGNKLWAYEVLLLNNTGGNSRFAYIRGNKTLLHDVFE